MAVTLVKDHLKNRKLPNVIQLFEEQNIKDVNIEEDGWDHEKLIGMGINLERDRGIVLSIIAGVKKILGPKSKILQDSIHGAIELHPLVAKFIDTPQFQRLRDIKQLGGVYYVYPGASHNRFEHSIGVCYLAGVFIEQLRERQPELGITDREVLCVKIAGLCHDMGHGPFSHLFQDLFMTEINPHSKWKHEDASVKLLDHLVKVNNLHDQLLKYGLDWEKDFPFISDLINGKTEDFNEKPFLYEIVANNISGVDVDKMDYLLRDCHGLGLQLTFDWKRYMLCCRVIQAGEDNQYHICPRDKEIGSLYQMFYIRDRLFRAAYQHKTKRMVEFMLNDALTKAEASILIRRTDNEPVKLSKAVEHMDAFTLLTDSVFYLIKTSNDPDLCESQELIKRVEKRDLYTFINRILLKKSPLPSPVESVKSPNLHNNSSTSDQSMNGEGTDENPSDSAERILRPDNSGIVTEIAELACTISDVPFNIMKEAIKLDQVKFSFGEHEENPIEKIYFYNKHSPNKAVLIKSTQTPVTFPQKCQDFEYRLYCKSKDESIIKAIRSGLVKFCEKRENAFELPPGEEK